MYNSSVEVRIFVNRVRYELFETFAVDIPENYHERYPTHQFVYLDNRAYIRRPNEILFYAGSNAGFYDMDSKGNITESSVVYSGQRF